AAGVAAGTAPDAMAYAVASPAMARGDSGAHATVNNNTQTMPCGSLMSNSSPSSPLRARARPRPGSPGTSLRWRTILNYSGSNPAAPPAPIFRDVAGYSIGLAARRVADPNHPAP